MTGVADHVDGHRLWSRLMELARHGARPDGGVDRPALSRAEAAVRRQLVAWAAEAGMTAFTDAAANLFLRYEGADPTQAPVLSGSHTDSQPTGGKFDGVFGVLAALEAVQALHDAGVRLRRAIEVVAWTNEEGGRFAPNFTGSALFTNRRALADVRALVDADGVTMGDAIDAILSGDTDVARREFGLPVHAYLELHIEQADVLERAGVPIGVVSGIQGTRRYRGRFLGQAAHAGTEPRDRRRDALLAGGRAIIALDARAAQSAEDFRFTVGMFEVLPGAPSVVPEEVRFSIDIRHPDDDLVDAFDADLTGILDREAHPCVAEHHQIVHAPSITFAPDLCARLFRNAEALSIPALGVLSAAGHDARELSYHCPSAMLFVPCRGGISHAPEEWAESEHLTMATQILATTLVELAEEE